MLTNIRPQNCSNPFQQVCGNIFKTKSLLVHHIGTKHGKVCIELLPIQLIVVCSLYPFRPCGICNSQSILFQVNDVLVELGYKALPCPVARDTKRDPEIQRKIMELKKERQQAEEVVPPVSAHFVSDGEAVSSQHQQQEETVYSPQQQQQSNNHVSFGPEFVRHIPMRKNKF